jgi:8-oxo-dGTP pyrophosphatase MutT (NUDIX family)
MSLAERLRRALDHPEVDGLLAGDHRATPAGADERIRAAAVLVPIVERPAPTVILTLRPHTLRSHAGQVSFPGGRIDPEDRDAVDAALRETEEEIGLPRRLVEVIGTADRYRTITGFDVTPVIGVVPPDLPLVAQPDEVAEIFEAPLAFLIDRRNQVEQSTTWQGQQRSYYEILWEDRRIWGATAAMIVNLSRRLAAAS